MLCFLLEEEEEGDEGGSILMDDEIWSTLPEELLFSVLACLPLSSFVRFRIICKRWNVVLRNPSSSLFFSSPPAFYNRPCAIFKSNHPILVSRRNSQLSVHPSPRMRKSLKLFPSLGSEEGGQMRLRWRNLDLDFLHLSDNLVSSHAGLLLVRQRATEYLVFNPLLNVWRKLPVLPIRYIFPASIVVIALLTFTAIYGINPASSSFKVIWGLWELFGSPTSFLYNSTNDEWKRINGPPVVYPATFENKATFRNNICYWATDNLDILAFDFEQETWHILRSRWVRESKAPISYRLWEWQGHLMMITRNNMLSQLSENNEWNDLNIPITVSRIMNTITNQYLPFRFACMGNILLLANLEINKMLAYNIVSKDFIISDIPRGFSIQTFLSFHPNLEAHWS